MNNVDIKAAKPGDTIRDDKVRGLHLRVFESKSCWYLAFRTKAGRQRKPKLADLSVMSLDQARKAAAEMLLVVGTGADPMQARQNERGAPTVDDLWAEYVKAHRKPWKSERDQTRIWTKNIKPKIGSRRVAEVTHADALAVHAAMSRAPYQANRTLALLSSVMAFAEAPKDGPTGWRPNGSNPCRHVHRYAEKKRKRYMTPLEAQTIAGLLRAAEAKHPASTAFVYLLIYTGARCGDIADAKWPDLQGNKLMLPDGKTGARAVHLPDAALAVIERLPRTKGGTITGIKYPRRLWDDVREAAGCPDLRLHDIRHSFASVALSAGLSLAQIGELLGHKSTQTTARYAHLMDDAATVAVQTTADAIAARMLQPVAELAAQ